MEADQGPVEFDEEPVPGSAGNWDGKAIRCEHCGEISGRLRPHEEKVMRMIRIRGALGTSALAKSTRLSAVGINRVLRSMRSRGLVVRGERVGNAGGGWEYTWSLAGPEASDADDTERSNALMRVLRAAKTRAAQLRAETKDELADRLEAAVSRLWPPDA